MRMTDKSNQLCGVNLGGWLVLERWITPSLFAGTDARDEYSLVQTPEGKEKVKWHRRTFIAEEDFKWLSENKVNAVRIPVGYWLFENDEPFTATVSYLDWAMEMAERYRLKVLIDLHALKGSQNGKDHSGRIGKAGWFDDPTHKQETIALLREIAERYNHSPALWGIALLNEPKVGLFSFFKLKKYYREAYDALRPLLRSGTHIVFSDGFLPRLFAGTIAKNSTVTAVMDVHWYQFGKANLGKYLKKLSSRPGQIARLQKKQPIIIGEWSGVLSHETLQGLSKEERTHLQKRHIEKQLEVYSSALGWFYWTYKTEAGGIWDFREQVENGSLLLK